MNAGVENTDMAILVTFLITVTKELTKAPSERRVFFPLTVSEGPAHHSREGSSPVQVNTFP